MHKNIEGKKKQVVNMTQGNILVILLNFAIPLLLGNLFQQLYNTVDTWVVGNYVGKNAFSAIGTLGSITNMILGFFMGFSNGASVVLSRYFGAGKLDKVKESMHTFVGFTIIMAIALTFLGLILTPLLVHAIASPEAVAKEQRIYLSIYFSGIAGLLIYNMGAAILRAVGNSRLPFLFLVVCTLCNITLDLIMVLCFHFGTAGVGFATIISQGISATLVIITLLRSKTCIQLTIKDIRINTKLLKEIVIQGFPAAIQMSITAFSNIFVQSYINFFGSDVMGGYTAYTKIDQLVTLPLQTIGLSITTFVGQNLGADNIRRARRGVNTAILMAVSTTVAVCIPVMYFAPTLVDFFIDDTELEVIKYGTLFLRFILPFFIVSGVQQVCTGALRGSGDSKTPMLIMLSCFVLFRQIYLFVMSHYISNTVLAIVFGYPAGWMLAALFMVIAYLRKFPRYKKD